MSIKQNPSAKGRTLNELLINLKKTNSIVLIWISPKSKNLHYINKDIVTHVSYLISLIYTSMRKFWKGEKKNVKKNNGKE